MSMSMSKVNLYSAFS